MAVNHFYHFTRPDLRNAKCSNSDRLTLAYPSVSALQTEQLREHPNRRLPWQFLGASSGINDSYDEVGIEMTNTTAVPRQTEHTSVNGDSCQLPVACWQEQELLRPPCFTPRHTPLAPHYYWVGLNSLLNALTLFFRVPFFIPFTSTSLLYTAYISHFSCTHTQPSFILFPIQ